MYQDLHCYIDFDWEKYANNSDGYFHELYKIIELAYQHKLTVFCSSQQVSEFKDSCSDWDNNFSKSHANKLDVLLENCIKKNDKNYCFKVCFSNENSSLYHIENLAISIIESDSKLISTSYNQDTALLSIKSETEFKKLQFDVVKNSEELLNWIQRSKTRNFNLSGKHGENNGNKWAKSKGKEVSSLLCDEYCAQLLLNTAIADFIEKEDRLFNFDEQHQTFIEFFYEGDTPQKQWHGFHLEEKEWDDRVPKSIRKHFGKN